MGMPLRFVYGPSNTISYGNPNQSLRSSLCSSFAFYQHRDDPESVTVLNRLQSPSHYESDAISPVFFSDLKSVRCSSVVEARLLRFWESKNVKHGGELMWMDLLMPETGCYLVFWAISLSVIMRLLCFWEARNFKKGGELQPLINILKEGGLFDLSLFDVLATHNLYGRHRSFVRWTRSAAMSQDSATAGSASGARPFCSLEEA
ncbi:hypothetical protein HID58_029307 [Brassica napus]|uniref:Uncharacterized protein n=1 Tax=Brassica napus TaxID=3708 RepID=A0ABQ8CCU0_BRANA|nr:hypothetical protein HID58_029307 [Brassica napus]